MKIKEIKNINVLYKYFELMLYLYQFLCYNFNFHFLHLQLEIIYQDEHLVAINKPHGLLVHRTRLANDADEFALQILRDQLEQRVFPNHRLDRKTGGVLSEADLRPF